MRIKTMQSQQRFESIVERRIRKLVEAFKLYGKNKQLSFNKVDKALGRPPCPPLGTTAEEKYLRSGYQERRRKIFQEINNFCGDHGIAMRFYLIGNDEGVKLYEGLNEIALVVGKRVTRHGQGRSKTNKGQLEGVTNIPEIDNNPKAKALIKALVTREVADIKARNALNEVLKLFGQEEKIEDENVETKLLLPSPNEAHNDLP